jgi:replicative superfamily II helicase
MVLDFGKLSLGGSQKQTEPRKLFTILNKNPRFRRPSDEQGDVLDRWYDKRIRTDNTIKMNTGAGKTLVGLLALQSSLNVQPAVYVTPDNYLVEQVIEEARALGISATEDVRDPDFVAGRSILVINVMKLIN